MKNDLGMLKSFGNLALLLKHVQEELMGLAGTYVDDTLLSNTDGFKLLNKKTSERFDSRSAGKARLTFSGILLARTDRTVPLQQLNQA